MPLPTLLISVILIQPPPPQQEPAPPPPAVREAPKAAAPQRISVGGSVQAVYTGPTPIWAPARALSEAQRARLEELAAHTDDICTRGLLIASPGSSSSRSDHLLWMIEHHPEWDGFFLDPLHGLAEPRSDQERSSYGRLKEAWLKQVGPEQQSGMVVHNAAMFFAIREPEFAISLLRRAREHEPNVPFYAEREGLVYAYSNMPMDRLRRYGIPPIPERQRIVEQANATLLDSEDWVVIAGALSVMQTLDNWAPPDLRNALSSRLKQLTGDGSGYSVLSRGQSRSAGYPAVACDAGIAQVQ